MSATVRFYQKPLGKYVSKWNYKKGENEVWIKRLNDTDWTAEIRNEAKFLGIPYTAKHTVSRGLGIRTAIRFHRRPRFLWSDTDEDLWVACEDGCLQSVREGLAHYGTGRRRSGQRREQRRRGASVSVF
jgi:hypothetical protein